MSVSRFVIGVLVFILMAGCAGKPPLETFENIDSNNYSVSLIVPKDTGSINQGNNSYDNVLNRLSFDNTKNFSNKGTSIPDFHALYTNVKNSDFLTEASTGFYSRDSGRYFTEASVGYSGKIDFTEDTDVYRLIFIPEKKRSYQKFNMIDGKIHHTVSLTPEEFVEKIKKTNFRCTIEVDSPYNTDSTYANFTRLARKEIYRDGYKDEMTGKIFKEKFWVKIDNKEIPVNVETYPYRNGSKAVIHTYLPGINLGNTVDYKTMKEKLFKEIERIVNS